MALITGSQPWLKDFLLNALLSPSLAPPSLSGHHLQALSGVCPKRTLLVHDGAHTIRAILTPSSASALDQDVDDLGLTPRALAGYYLAPIAATIMHDPVGINATLLLRQVAVFPDRSRLLPAAHPPPVTADHDVTIALRASHGRHLAALVSSSALTRTERLSALDTAAIIQRFRTLSTDQSLPPHDLLPVGSRPVFAPVSSPVHDGNNTPPQQRPIQHNCQPDNDNDGSDNDDTDRDTQRTTDRADPDWLVALPPSDEEAVLPLTQHVALDESTDVGAKQADHDFLGAQACEDTGNVQGDRTNEVAEDTGSDKEKSTGDGHQNNAGDNCEKVDERDNVDVEDVDSNKAGDGNVRSVAGSDGINAGDGGGDNTRDGVIDVEDRNAENAEDRDVVDNRRRDGKCVYGDGNDGDDAKGNIPEDAGVECSAHFSAQYGGKGAADDTAGTASEAIIETEARAPSALQNAESIAQKSAQTRSNASGSALHSRSSSPPRTPPPRRRPRCRSRLYSPSLSFSCDSQVPSPPPLPPKSPPIPQLRSPSIYPSSSSSSTIEEMPRKPAADPPLTRRRGRSTEETNVATDMGTPRANKRARLPSAAPARTTRSRGKQAANEHELGGELEERLPPVVQADPSQELHEPVTPMPMTPLPFTPGPDENSVELVEKEIEKPNKNIKEGESAEKDKNVEKADKPTKEAASKQPDAHLPESEELESEAAPLPLTQHVETENPIAEDPDAEPSDTPEKVTGPVEGGKAAAPDKEVKKGDKKAMEAKSNITKERKDVVELDAIEETKKEAKEKPGEEKIPTKDADVDKDTMNVEEAHGAKQGADLEKDSGTGKGSSREAKETKETKETDVDKIEPQQAGKGGESGRNPIDRPTQGKEASSKTANGSSSAPLPSTTAKQKPSDKIDENGSTSAVVADPALEREPTKDTAGEKEELNEEEKKMQATVESEFVYLRELRIARDRDPIGFIINPESFLPSDPSCAPPPLRKSSSDGVRFADPPAIPVVPESAPM